jgi:hypothetical protein
MLLVAFGVVCIMPASAVAIDNSGSSIGVAKRQTTAPGFPKVNITLYTNEQCDSAGGVPDRVKQRDNYSVGLCSISPFFGPTQSFQKFYSIKTAADIPPDVTCTLQTFVEDVCQGSPNIRGGANECINVPSGSTFYTWECSIIALPSADVTFFTFPKCPSTGESLIQQPLYDIPANACRPPGSSLNMLRYLSVRAVSKANFPPNISCQIVLYDSRDCNPHTILDRADPNVCLSPSQGLNIQGFKWECRPV